MKEDRDQGSPLIAIVGPCASGKTTLAEALQALDFNARQIAQEHSYVAEMWEQITNPDVLIYLDASYDTCTRRKNLNWSKAEYQTQIERLSDARERCDLYIDTERSTPEEIVKIALDFLNSSG
jgi:deoxyadenosine/deoxycytidine kinase